MFGFCLVHAPTGLIINSIRWQHHPNRSFWIPSIRGYEGHSWVGASPSRRPRFTGIKYVCPGTLVAGSIVSQASCLRSDVSSQAAFSVPDASSHPDRPRARRPTSSRWVSTCDSPVLGRSKICRSAASPQRLSRVRSKMDSHAVAATKSLDRRSDPSSVVSSSGFLVYRLAK